MTYGDGGAWRAGPHAVYRRLASTALDALGRSVDGLASVDVGAGTGAMAEELAARGARVVSADRELAMLRLAPPPRLVCDIGALALRGGCVDLVTASFVLSHVEEPGAALAELARVTRSGGMTMAVGFPGGDTHPVKRAVQAVLAEAGYRAPAWYLRLKEIGEARVGTLAALAELAGEAGLRGVQASPLLAPLSGLDSETVVAWRLGMAQVAPFVAALPPGRRRRLIDEARAAVETVGLAEPVRLLVLVAEV